LCDEPTGALDYKTSKDILELLEKINEKYKTTIIVVTHNDAIKNMAHRVMRLRDGQIIKNKINETRTKAEDLEW
jgi:putative ABC transport system ATP-binding protein